MPRKLNERERKEWSRQVNEGLRLARGMQVQGSPKKIIRLDLRKLKYRWNVIRDILEGLDAEWPIDRCSMFLRNRFDGRTLPGKVVVDVGLKAGYSRKTIYRALQRWATLKRRNKKAMWQFDWEKAGRRNFLGEVKGHVGDEGDVEGENRPTRARKQATQETGESRPGNVGSRHNVGKNLRRRLA